MLIFEPKYEWEMSWKSSFEQLTKHGGNFQ